MLRAAHLTMLYFLLVYIFSFLIDLIPVARRTDQQKDLEILLLRQLQIMQRQHPQKPNVSRWEKLALTVLAAKLAGPRRGAKARLDGVLRLLEPDTPWLCREPWSSGGTES